MANLNKGLIVDATIVTRTDADTYPTHGAKSGKGGHRSVADVAERDAIFLERREFGQTVYVQAEDKTYILKPVTNDPADNGNWAEVVASGGGPAVTEWKAGQQKANSLVLYNGNVYRVKNDIANGQAAPEGNTQYYQLLADGATVLAALNALASRIDTEKNRLDNLVAGAPEALDTLKEIADQIAADEQGVAAILAKLQQHTQQLVDVAHLTGDETFTGNKTFTAPIASNSTVILSYQGTKLLSLPANNLFLGQYAGSTVGGAENTGVGFNTMSAVSGGSYNTAIGFYSLVNVLNGSENASFGRLTLQNVVNGSANTGVGNTALAGVVGGNENIGIGKDSGRYFGGTPNTNPSQSIFIGNRTEPLADNGNNEVVIGYNAKGHGTNTVTIGNTSTTDNYFNGSVYAAKFVGDGSKLTGIPKGPATTDGLPEGVTNKYFTTLRVLATQLNYSFSNNSGPATAADYPVEGGMTIDQAFKNIGGLFADFDNVASNAKLPYLKAYGAPTNRPITSNDSVTTAFETLEKRIDDLAANTIDDSNYAKLDQENVFAQETTLNGATLAYHTPFSLLGDDYKVNMIGETGVTYVFYEPDGDQDVYAGLVIVNPTFVSLPQPGAFISLGTTTGAVVAGGRLEVSDDLRLLVNGVRQVSENEIKQDLSGNESDKVPSVAAVRAAIAAGGGTAPDLSKYAKLDSPNVFTKTNFYQSSDKQTTMSASSTGLSWTNDIGLANLNYDIATGNLVFNAAGMLVPTPNQPKSAATKEYVDSKLTGGGSSVVIEQDLSSNSTTSVPSVAAVANELDENYLPAYYATDGTKVVGTGTSFVSSVTVGLGKNRTTLGLGKVTVSTTNDPAKSTQLNPGSLVYQDDASGKLGTLGYTVVGNTGTLKLDSDVVEVPQPTIPTSAATKSYVDAKVAAAGGGGGGTAAPLYGSTGQATDGAMTQKATTDALATKADLVGGKLSAAQLPYVGFTPSDIKADLKATATKWREGELDFNAVITPGSKPGMKFISGNGSITYVYEYMLSSADSNGTVFNWVRYTAA